MFSIISSNKVALDSLDHKAPRGSRIALSRRFYFEHVLDKFMTENSFMSITDQGCSSGAFISGMHDTGYLALGLEGSDYSEKTKRGDWGRLNNICLFTCDITKKFEIKFCDENFKFDILTSFEVLEHIENKDLDAVFDNFKNITHKNSIFLFSIGILDSPYHVNLFKKKSQWLEYFKKYNLVEDKNIKDYFGDILLHNEWHNLKFYLKFQNNDGLKIPKRNLLEKIFPKYYSSSFGKFLTKFIKFSYYN